MVKLIELSKSIYIYIYMMGRLINSSTMGRLRDYVLNKPGLCFVQDWSCHELIVNFAAFQENILCNAKNI